MSLNTNTDPEQYIRNKFPIGITVLASMIPPKPGDAYRKDQRIWQTVISGSILSNGIDNLHQIEVLGLNRSGEDIYIERQTAFPTTYETIIVPSSLLITDGDSDKIAPDHYGLYRTALGQAIICAEAFGRKPINVNRTSVDMAQLELSQLDQKNLSQKKGLYTYHSLDQLDILRQIGHDAEEKWIQNYDIRIYGLIYPLERPILNSLVECRLPRYLTALDFVKAQNIYQSKIPLSKEILEKEVVSFKSTREDKAACYMELMRKHRNNRLFVRSPDGKRKAIVLSWEKPIESNDPIHLVLVEYRIDFGNPVLITFFDSTLNQWTFDDIYIFSATI